MLNILDMLCYCLSWTQIETKLLMLAQPKKDSPWLYAQGEFNVAFIMNCEFIKSEGGLL